MQTKLAFVFPGQGSQQVGMLGAMAEQYITIKDSFVEASDAVGVDLWALSQHGPADALNSTENTQPALLAASVALWRCWQDAGGVIPAYLAGHSLGEYSALVCAGALSLHDGAKLVHERGQLMQQAVPEGVGAMAAVLGSNEATVSQACKSAEQGQIVAPANFNSPGQIVIAGHSEAVDRALANLQEAGVKKTVKLKVSVPSHTMLMRDAADQLAARMQALEWHMPAIPIVHNVNGKTAHNLDELRQHLQEQLYMPVLWSNCVAALVQQGTTYLFECGPGKVLTGLTKRIDRSLKGMALGEPEAFASALENSFD